MAKQTRESFITNLLGKKTASEELESALGAMQTALDKMGHQRKEYTNENKKALMEDLTSEVNTLLSGITDNVPDGLANRLIAEIMGGLMEAGMEMPEEVEDMLDEESDMMDEEEDMYDEDSKSVKELTDTVKSLAEETNDVARDLSAVVKSVTDMAHVLRDLAPLAAETGKIDALDTRIKALERQLKSRPKSASKAAETLVTDEDVVAQIKKSAEAPKTMLGIQLEKEVSYE